MSNDDTGLRAAFETAAWAYYQSLKAGGWSDPQEGDNTPEALFWRSEENPALYGVHQIQAAWQGWQMAHRYYRVNDVSELVSEVAGVAGLKVGDDVFEKLVPALNGAVKRDEEPTDAEIEQAAQSLWSELGTEPGSYFRVSDTPWGTGWSAGDGPKGGPL